MGITVLQRPGQRSALDRACEVIGHIMTGTWGEDTPTQLAGQWGEAIVR